MVQDDQPVQPTPQRLPLVRLTKGQEVSLGCGTLILIAIIVAICSGKATVDLSPVQSRLNDIDKRLQQVEQKIDQLDKKIKP
jgi:cell division protein FtsL